MWSAALLRFIRRRIVLAVIFCMSLTYCLVNFMQSSGPLDIEEFEVHRTKPLIWRTADDDWNTGNQTNATSNVCRNSVQGRLWLVDDRGWLCDRKDLVTSTGCCDPEAASSALHSCTTCVPGVHCCSNYEQCVSCCLNPDKRELLERVIAEATGRQRAVFATVADHFELCLAKCRTDSHSVRHENQYRRPTEKHCFGLTYEIDSDKDETKPGAVEAPKVASESKDNERPGGSLNDIQ